MCWRGPPRVTGSDKVGTVPLFDVRVGFKEWGPASCIAPYRSGEKRRTLGASRRGGVEPHQSGSPCSRAVLIFPLIRGFRQPHI